MDNFSQNMIALRNKHSMTTTQVAQIAGIDKATYEKMELGFEKVSYEILEKLANFYSVDITYFGEAHEMPKTTNTNEGSTAAKKEKKTYTRTKKIKVFNILTLITSCLLLICLAIPLEPRAGIYPFNYVFSGDAFNWGTLTCILLYICAFWCLANAIIHISSINLDQGKYGKASKITSVVIISITSLFVFLMFINFAFVHYFHSAVSIIHAIIYIVALIFEIIKLVLHVKNNKKED